MAEISNETLCMLVVVFIIVLILFNMGKTDKNDTSSPCGSMKIASKFTNDYGLTITDPNSPLGKPKGGFGEPDLCYEAIVGNNCNNSKTNPMVVGVAPTSFYLDPTNAGIMGDPKTLGGNFDSNRLAMNVNKTGYIYPPDMQGDVKYIAEFGIDKGINGASGLLHNNALSVYGNPMSMRVVPSQNLNRN